MWGWVEQPGLEAVDDDRVMHEERRKTEQLMWIVDNLYSERDVLIHYIVQHEAAWAARTGRAVVMARERARLNEVDLRISSAALMIQQRQEEVRPIQYQEAWCESSAPVPSPPSGLSPVPSRPSPTLPLQQSAVSSQALLVSPPPSSPSQQFTEEKVDSRKLDNEQRESEQRERERRESEKRGEDEREKEPPQQKEHDLSKAKGGPELMDLFGAGGEGAGQQQLLRRQQRQQQQQSQAKEGQATDLFARSREEVERGDGIVDGREEVVDTEVVVTVVEEKMDDGGCGADRKHPLQEKELELVLAKKRAKSLPQQQQHQQQHQQQPKHKGLLPPPPWPPPLSSRKGNVNGEIRDHGTGWFGVEIGVTGSVFGGLIGGLVSTAWWRGRSTLQREQQQREQWKRVGTNRAGIDTGSCLHPGSTPSD